MIKDKVVDILKELHEVDGLLIDLGWAIPADFNKKIETVDLETLMEYFKEVTEYISENQFFHINPEKSDEYKSAYLKARSDLSEGWFNPNDYNRKSLINHLLSCDAYSIEYLEGYCDGAFA